jgi:hypothetical protein
MDAIFPFDAAHVIAFHDACLEFGKWPEEEAPAHPPGDIWPWVEANHASNARADDSDGSRRRETIARLDAAIHGTLAHCLKPAARLHPETPATMIDRLSVLAVRIRAAEAQSPGRGLEALERERREIAAALARLLTECVAGTARFEPVPALQP